MPAPPSTRPPGSIRRRIGVPILLLLAVACTTLLAVQNASAQTGVTGKTATSQDKAAEAFTACMRTHGVPDFPGITIAADGQIQLNSGAVNPISDTYRAAAEACASLLPEGSELPNEPEPPTPAAPALQFTCSGDCPAAPEPPDPPR